MENLENILSPHREASVKEVVNDLKKWIVVDEKSHQLILHTYTEKLLHGNMIDSNFAFILLCSINDALSKIKISVELKEKWQFIYDKLILLCKEVREKDKTSIIKVM